MSMSNHIKEHLALDFTKPIADGNFLVPFGDSITATMWKQLTPSSISVTGTTATVTMATAPACQAGDIVRGAAWASSEYNGDHVVTSTPTSTTFTFEVAAGTASVPSNSTAVMYFSNDMNFSGNYIHFLQAYGKCRFRITKNGSTGGDDSTEALARLGVDLLQHRPNRALIMLGTNDMLNTASTDISTFVSNMTSIYTQCLNAGIAVDACTIPPLGPGHASASSTTIVGWLQEANRWIREYANRTKGMRLHDVYNWLTDPTLANGAMLAANTTDNVHPNDVGHKVIGKAMAANYVTWLGNAPDRFPSSQADSYTFNTLSKNRFLNPLFQGTTVATSWSTTYTGAGNSQVSSCVDRTVVDDGDALGKNQKSVLTSASSGTHLVYQDGTAFATRMVAGNRYKGQGSVKFLLGTITSILSHITLGFTVDGIARTYRAGLHYVPEDGTYFFETPEFTYPAGASSLLFYLSSATTGTGNPEISWGRAGLIDVT